MKRKELQKVKEENLDKKGNTNRMCKFKTIVRKRRIVRSLLAENLGKFIIEVNNICRFKLIIGKKSERGEIKIKKTAIFVIKNRCVGKKKNFKDEK